MYKNILEKLLDSYLVERDAEKTLSLLTDDVYSIGTGVQEVAHSKKEFEKLIWAEIAQLSMPIHYTLETYYEKEVVPGMVISCICDVMTILELEDREPVYYKTRFTADFRKEGDEFLAYQLHMSEPSATQEEHTFFPLHYGEVAVHEIDEEDQLGLVELMKRTLPGGAMGGYVEPGFPLYFINDELLSWLGFTYDEFLQEFGQDMIHTIHPEDAGRVEKYINERFRVGNEYTVEYRMRKKGGEYVWVRDIGRKTVTPNGRVAMISIIADISSEMRKQETFDLAIETMRKERRRQDRLTGMLTRGPAEVLIEQSLMQNTVGAFLMIDLDNFKLINDVKGHPVGDQVLRLFAERLKENLPETAIAARLGGDEFIIFLPECEDVEKVRVIADNILRSAENLVEDSILADKIGVSIGIALAPEDGEHFAELYSNADKGQYFAKRNGKGRYSFYSQSPRVPAFGEMKADLHTLRRMVQEVQVEKGAFLVEYDTFNKVYQFMGRNIDRMKQNMQILLFTLDTHVTEARTKLLSENRKILENAIRYSLRIGDLMMDFNANQIVVMLVNCDMENAGKVAERILNEYKLEAGERMVDVTYESGSINEVTG